jgi:hypothetical protein
MQWGVVGGAILRRVEEGCSPSLNLTAPPYDIGPLDSPVDMYVDDTFGVGRSDHVRVARDRVVLVSEGVLAPSTAISSEKSVLASSAAILGYHVDCLAVTIRPKDRAIDKLFYVLFSFSCSDRQPLVLWQCLSSLVNMYSHMIRGMRPFVAPIINMTYRTSGHHTQTARASASAAFAIKMRRAAMVLLVTDRARLSVQLDIFLLTSGYTSLL